jgi:hypothetical protein
MVNFATSGEIAPMAARSGARIVPADGSDGHGNFDERVAVLVLDNDALDVALVDQVADPIDEVASQDMNFFNKTLKAHSLDYVGGRRQGPRTQFT